MIKKLFRIIKFVIKTYLFEIKEKIAFDRFLKDWRSQNANNTTTPVIMFPIFKVKVGTGTYGPLDIRTFSDDNESVIIGNYCSIAKDVVFVAGGAHSSNLFSTFPWRASFNFGDERRDCFSKGPIILDDDVWFGTGAIVLSNVHIGKGAVVGAGCVVSKNIPPYAIVVGNPQRIIKYRFSEKVIEILLKTDFSIIDINYINNKLAALYTPIDNVKSIEDSFSELMINNT